MDLCSWAARLKCLLRDKPARDQTGAKVPPASSRKLWLLPSAPEVWFNLSPSRNPNEVHGWICTALTLNHEEHYIDSSNAARLKCGPLLQRYGSCR